MTSYTVECKQASSDDSWRAVATVGDPQTFGGHTPMSTRPSLSHTITQLQPGEEYILRVFCQNSVGVSKLNSSQFLARLLSILLHCMYCV